MRVPRPTDEDKAYFRSIVPEGPGIEVKPMFGNLGAFVNGNMFMGLFGSSIGLRLKPDDATALLALPGAGPYGPSERPMRGYVSMPQSFRGQPETDLWVSRALDHMAGMPAKAAKTT